MFTDVVDSAGHRIHVSYVRQDDLAKFGLNYPAVFSSAFITGWLHRLLTSSGSNRSSIRRLFRPSFPLLGMGTKEVRALFSEGERKSQHPVKWGHTQSDNKIFLERGQYGYGALKTAKSFKQAKDAYSSWAGELLIANRPQMKTKRVLAILAAEPLLSTAFWTSRFGPKLSRAEREFVLLWLNSTPGLLMFLSSSLHKKGELFEFKKSQADPFWIPDHKSVKASLLHRCWKRVRQKEFSFYKEDFEFLAGCTSRHEMDQNPRYAIDRLFVGSLYDEVELKKFYEDLSEDPIFR